MRRIVLLGTLLVLTVVGSLLAPVSSAAPATPFDVTGFVEDASAPLPPTSLEGEDVAFLLRPLTRVSTTAEPHVVDGGLTIYGTPSTNYFKQNDQGFYLRSTYEQTVVEGAEVRVAGRYVDAPEGARFIAQYVWNPPYAGGDGTGAVPRCAMQPALSAKPFLFVATIKDARVHAPCTGIGGLPGGFNLRDFQLVSGAAAPAVVSYGGLVDIYVSPTTVYIHEGKRSDFGTVVRARNDVKVWGNFASVRGAWVLVAKVVMSPPGEQAASERVIADVTLLEGESGWSGKSRGPAFNTGDLTASLTWTETSEGWSVSGPWRLSNSAGDVLEGFLEGAVSGGRILADLLLSGGAGYYEGAQGTGTFDGTAGGLTRPTALDGRLDLTVSRGSVSSSESPSPSPSPSP
jgi:hypothetical protein